MKKTIVLAVCGDCVTSSGRLGWRTDGIFEASYRSTATTAGFVLQRERIRYWSVCDIFNRDEREDQGQREPCLMMKPCHSRAAAAPMVGVEAWISLIASLGNTQVSGSRVRV
jgi:hypothetical protein